MHDQPPDKSPAPPFQTSERFPGDAPIVPLALVRFKVDSLVDEVNGHGVATGNKLLKCYRFDGTSTGQRAYIVVPYFAHAKGHVIYAMQTDGGTGKLFAGSGSGNARPAAWVEVNPFQVGYGRLLDEWIGGTNYVRFQPVDSDTLDDMPVDPVYVLCAFPMIRGGLDGGFAYSLGVKSGDILGYVYLGGSFPLYTTDADGNNPTLHGVSYYMLYNPPWLPRATQRFQVPINESTDAARPHYVAGYVRFVTNT